MALIFRILFCAKILKHVTNVKIPELIVDSYLGQCIQEHRVKHRQERMSTQLTSSKIPVLLIPKKIIINISFFLHFFKLLEISWKYLQI